jgi:Lar family restriction alleviation protein
MSDKKTDTKSKCEAKTITNQKIELCPFCGGECKFLTNNSRDDYYIYYNIVCVDCCALSDEFKTKAEAIATWNTRISDKVIDELLAVMVKYSNEPENDDVYIGYNHLKQLKEDIKSGALSAKQSKKAEV